MSSLKRRLTQLFSTTLSASAALGMVAAGLSPHATAAQVVIRGESSWRGLIRLLGSDEDPGDGANGGGRPINGICVIGLPSNAVARASNSAMQDAQEIADNSQASPQTEAQIDRVWNQRPLLLWQGRSTIGIRRADTGTVVWRDAAPRTELDWHQLRSQGVNLTPGKRYEWVFYFSATAANPSAQLPFEVVDDVVRDRISTDLQALEAELQEEQAGEEAIALAKAKYFLDQDLEVDAAQEMFLVAEPSAELIAAREALVEMVCETEEETEQPSERPPERPPERV